MSRSLAIVLSTLAVATCTAGPGAAAATRTAAATPRVVTVAGIGEEGYSGDGQRATDARFGTDGTIDVGPDGTLFLVDDWGGRVRSVNADGVIDTVPGTRALRSPETDGPEVGGWQYSPRNRPTAADIGPDGTLYIAGSLQVGRLGADGTVTGIADLQATDIDWPSDIGADAAGNVYVGGDGRIVRIDPAGTATTIAGGGSVSALDVDGKAATEASLGRFHVDFAVSPQGAVYVVVGPDEELGHPATTVHRIDPDGTLHTVAGGREAGLAGDGGPAAKARLGSRGGSVAVDQQGALHVYDRGNNLVRIIGEDGVIESIAPSVPSDLGGGNGASDLAVGPRGEIYLRIGARVDKLVRDNDEPESRPAKQPTYPARFPNDEPGTVHTVAGSGETEQPDPQPQPHPDEPANPRIAAGQDGTRYYADPARNRVMKVTADGKSSVFAGTGKADFAGDGKVATEAALNVPTGLAVAPDGGVYIADSGNNRLRLVDRTGVITTVAGNGIAGEPGGLFGEEITVHGDSGPAIDATVTPTDVALGPDGSLFIAEAANSRISRVTPDGTITTFAGNGDRWMEKADGHPAAEASFFRPFAVTVGPDGSVYLLDEDVEKARPAVRVIDPVGIVRTVAGNAYRGSEEAGFGGDGGPAGQAELNNPTDIAAGQDGTLYIADTYNARIRAVDTNGIITTLAGTGERADSGDDEAAAKAAVNEPATVAVGADGVLHTISLPADRIRSIADGVITTTATLRTQEKWDTDKSATDTPMAPSNVAVDRDGRLLVADRLGGLTVIDADGGVDRPYADRPELAGVQAVTVGPDGAHYVAAVGVVYRVAGESVIPVAGGGPDSGPNDRVDRGQPATVASLGPIQDLAVGPAGRLYLATTENVYRLEADGTLTAAAGPGKIAPGGIAVDAEEQLYIADSDGNRVYRVTKDGERVTVAGDGVSSSPEEDDEGADATEVHLFHPFDVAADGGGNLFVSGFEGVYRVEPDGTFSTVYRNRANADGSHDALGPLTTDRHGDVYFVDGGRNTVKLLVRPGELATPFDWSTVVWLAVGALALAVGWWWWRRRRTSQHPPTPTEPAEPTPATDPEPSDDKESATEPDSANPTEEKPSGDEAEPGDKPSGT